METDRVGIDEIGRVANIEGHDQTLVFREISHRLAVVPIYQPGRIWDKILSALNPGRWARAFAGWVIEGVHGTLCGVVERASGEDADNCRRESGR